jgi:hypothetical protein
VPARIAAFAGAVVLAIAGCADNGERAAAPDEAGRAVVGDDDVRAIREKPFPNLADFPPAPEISSAEERQRSLDDLQQDRAAAGRDD